MDLLQDLLNDKELHRNLLKFATMLTVSKAISLRDAQFMVNTAATLVGFTAYHLITKKIPLPIDNPDLQRVANTWMKVGTMLVVSQLYKGGKLNESFLMDTAMTLAAFNVADILVPRFVPQFESSLMSSVATDVAVVLIMSVSKALMSGNQVSPKLFVEAGWTLSGFILYDLIIALAC